jgi:hypothetical protein
MDKSSKLSPLAEVERRVWKEGMAWMRQRMQEELQILADEQGEFSPLKRADPGANQVPNLAVGDDGGAGGG